MPRPVAVLAGGVAVLAAFWVLLAGPFLTQRTSGVASVAQPPALLQVALVPVPGGGTACLDKATVTRASSVLQVRVGTFGRPSAGLGVSISAPGYRYATSLRRGSFPDNALISVPVVPPPADTLARVCLRNPGLHQIALYGATSPLSRSHTSVNGRAVRPNVALSLLSGTRPRLVDARGAILRRALLFDPGIVATWWLWPLVVLVFLLGPLGLIALLAAATRDDARTPPQ